MAEPEKKTCHKTTRRENFRVVVEPDCGTGSEESYCRDIKTEIGRHVDYVKFASVEYDTLEVCSFCGRAWEPAKDEEGPHCSGCGADIKEEPPND